MMNEIKTYAFSINTDEIYQGMNNGKADSLVSYLKSVTGFVGVNQEIYRQYFLFRTAEERNEGHMKAKELGFITAVVIEQNAYVDEKYLR